MRRKTLWAAVALACLFMLSGCSESTVVGDNGARAANEVEQETVYILNVRPESRRFHYPHCASVRLMREENKRVFCGTRETVMAMGYTPCGNCQP